MTNTNQQLAALTLGGPAMMDQLLYHKTDSRHKRGNHIPQKRLEFLTTQREPISNARWWLHITSNWLLTINELTIMIINGTITSHYYPLSILAVNRSRLIARHESPFLVLTTISNTINHNC